MPPDLLSPFPQRVPAKFSLWGKAGTRWKTVSHITNLEWPKTEARPKSLTHSMVDEAGAGEAQAMPTVHARSHLQPPIRGEDQTRSITAEDDWAVPSEAKIKQDQLQLKTTGQCPQRRRSRSITAEDDWAVPSEAKINYGRRSITAEDDWAEPSEAKINYSRRSITAEDDWAMLSEAKINYSRRSITAEDDWAMLSEAKIIHKAKINYSRRRQGNALRGEDQLQPKTTGQCSQRRRSITAEDDRAMPSEAKINYSQAKINYSRRRLGNALSGEDHILRVTELL
ncbi:hypothetical protein BKA56DRAFT_714820 [Ilyonectria sp. MPI-CAGE-AT-0026]|nr:hypothetical protein BKA56DRAFT_714820 [Ilyonectria sp. MPI-CAGE-AT-0026]